MTTSVLAAVGLLTIIKPLIALGVLLLCLFIYYLLRN